MINYQDVLGQLLAFGLQVNDLVVGRMRRCRVDGKDKEKRGWYLLHEVTRDDGQTMLVGSFGVWHGNDSNTQKVVLAKENRLTPEQLDAIKAQQKRAQQQAEADRKRAGEEAGKRAARAWAQYTEAGHCDYLDRKGVAGHGVRYTGGGSIAIPMLDTKGKIHGLQIIYGSEGKQKKGRDKDFWPTGLLKKGHFFQIGAIGHLVIIAEGYATGASVHQATGYPVVIAFDAGNLRPVAGAIRAKYPKAKILIAADDDYFTAAKSGSNPGISSADAAAIAVGGAWVAPVFAAERPSDSKGPTDFNDLHALEGLHVVRTQIEAKLSALQWVGAAVQPRARATQGGGDGGKLAIGDVEELFARYALVYGAGGVCFDHDHHMLVKLSDVRDACADKNFVRDWQADIDRRKVVTMKEVGFDPTERDTSIKCNLWAGWPTVPKSGSCSELLDLLYYLCSAEPEGNRDTIYQWLLKWLAYPIQNPGAKMKTALVVHGPQGTGKNLFFDCIRDIYGEYGKTIDQSALEDKHNDWASKKLFLIADEVIAQQEMHHIKNKLKGMVTGDTIRVNPKHVAAHEERNHVNLVFLSNEAKPLVLERDDRRYFVMWTPPKLDEVNYRAIAEEIRNGGVAALHDFLLRVDLSDFAPDAKVPMTHAKRELINISMDGWEQFAMSWAEGLLAHQGVLPLPVDCDTLYQAYCRWSEENGQRFKERKNEFSSKVGKLNGYGKRERQHVMIGHARRQVTMLYPLNQTEPPAGTTLSAWNSDCIAKVQDAIKTARSGESYEYA
ncbi:DUF5906 domain-containing protein [Chitinilyticum aquatile]|uniref:DUF5906 domain-containing protein n=1 Tax=Chitinilyticum aquatile TaxID=362520 RepID=UPI0003FC8679|nr:DUF5906 domain-containing protein [Chitinilyticum aquatile]